MFQILLNFFWLIAIPFGCGLLVTKYMPEDKQTAGQTWVNGYLIMIAFFHCFYLAFVLLGSTSFKLLTLVFGVFIVIFALISAWAGRKIIYICFLRMKNKEALILKSVFAVVVILQIVMRLLQQVSDGDDAFFIATATATWSSNTMNLIRPYTGFVTEYLDVRHAFSSAPIWLAFLSKVTIVHPAIMGHSVLALILIILHYIVILNIGDVLFRRKKTEKYIFATIIGLFNMYGYVSIYTAQTFFLTRTWQGKSIFANLLLPCIFMVLIWLAEKKTETKDEKIYCIIAATTMFAATAMTTMAVFIIPFVFMLGLIFLAIFRKNPRLLWKGLLACVPTGIVGLIFLMA